MYISSFARPTHHTRNDKLEPASLVLPPFFNKWRRWLFLICLTIRLIQKIYVIIIYFVMSCFITNSTLSMIYILYICIKFLIKTNGQICEKKSKASSIKKRREYIYNYHIICLLWPLQFFLARDKIPSNNNFRTNRILFDCVRIFRMWWFDCNTIGTSKFQCKNSSGTIRCKLVAGYMNVYYSVQFFR